MTTSQLDLSIQKGSRLVQPVLVTTNGNSVPLLPGTKARMQIRANRNSATVLAELSVDNSRLAIDTDAAKVTITFASAYTAGFTFTRAVYDLKLVYPDNEEETIIEGRVFVFPSVTK